MWVEYIRWPQPLVSVYSEMLTTQSIKSGYFPYVPPYPLYHPPSSKHLPLEVWYCILYGNTSTMTLRWIQATMDHLSPPHYLTVYSCLHCTSLPSQTGWTPLYYASWDGHVSVVKMLLKRGADINLADQVECVGEMPTFDEMGCQQFWVYRNQHIFQN